MVHMIGVAVNPNPGKCTRRDALIAIGITVALLVFFAIIILLFTFGFRSEVSVGERPNFEWDENAVNKHM